MSARAKQLHDRAIVIDSHDDTTQRLLSDKTFDISKRQKNGNIDIPRMREGGLDGLFFSIWVPADVTGMPAVNTATALIDSVHKMRAHPNDLMLATTAADVRRAASEHKIAALMGMEGGHMINDDLGQLRKYAAAGVRYLTLTHFKNNNWADSSTDKPAHNGLTPFGPSCTDQPAGRWSVGLSRTSLDKTFYGVPASPITGDRVALVVPRDREPPAQHDRRHAARAREERRRRDDQLPRRLPQRGVPRREREEERHRRRGDGGDVEEMRRQRGVHDDGERADRSRGDGQGRAAQW